MDHRHYCIILWLWMNWMDHLRHSISMFWILTVIRRIVDRYWIRNFNRNHRDNRDHWCRFWERRC